MIAFRSDLITLEELLIGKYRNAFLECNQDTPEQKSLRFAIKTNLLYSNRNALHEDKIHQIHISKLFEC